jgi:hypothetical protein
MRISRVVLPLLVVVAAAVAVYVVQPAWIRNTTVLGLAFSAIFGAATGASEIISRYRDEPVRAIVNLFGLTYLLANGVLSLIAFGVLSRYSSQILPGIAQDWLLQAIVAGFGAMTIVRSKLFIFRAEDGKEYPIGPSIVIETFLRMLDRKIDRYRAARRQALVTDCMQEITDFHAAADYLAASLLSFQNLTQDEKASITSVVEQYKKTNWHPRLQVMAIGFAFLTIAGEENFDQVIKSLRSYLKGLGGHPAPPPVPPVPPARPASPTAILTGAPPETPTSILSGAPGAPSPGTPPVTPQTPGA